jgi:hypothetical protein
MVQHTFSKPDWLTDWNAWYANNLKIFMTIPGIFTAQRFQAISGSPPSFMAVYTVDPNVFESEIYLKNGGGGKASERFRPAYQVWKRNLFEGMIEAPNVSDGNYLVIKDDVNREMKLSSYTLQILETTGFHKTTPWRGISIIQNNDVAQIPLESGVTIYKPITTQMRPT